MKITITRAFERTRQIADFVPIKAYCEASVEVDGVEDATNPQEEALLKKVFENYSKGLDTFVQSEVEKTLINYRPVCIACMGKGDRVLLNKEGICGDCVNRMQMEARQFANGNAKNRPAPIKPPSKPNG